MKTLLAVAIAACLVGVGCDEDPARKVKIEAHPPQQPTSVQPSQPASASATASHSATASPTATAQAPVHPVKTSAHPRARVTLPPLFGWLQEFCPLAPEDSSGPSSFAAQGPCEFQHQGLASCQAIGDDFLVAVTRKAKQGTMVAFINVEQYHGPGSYEGSQIFVALQNGTTIHRWSSDTVSTVVGPGEAFLDISKAHLELEPTLQDCSKLIGPSTGYQFQCGERGNSNPAGDKADEVVAGKLQCAGKQ